jgi:hypothetical protein
VKRHSFFGDWKGGDKGDMGDKEDKGDKEEK